MKKVRILFIILTIVWMITVFCFSHQTADLSSNTSSNVTKIIAKIIYRNNLTENELELKIQELDPIIRKLAHYTLYTIGGILICTTLSTYDLSNKKKIFISQILGSIYAVTDEIHQYFVPGRACELKDILIDSFGVFTGIILLLILLKLCSIINKHIKSKKGVLNND